MTQELGPNQRKWLAALRSGEYRQCTGWLSRITGPRTERNCCLGVACRIFMEEPAKPWLDIQRTLLVTERVTGKPQAFCNHPGDDEGEQQICPEQVRQILALRTRSGDIAGMTLKRGRWLSEANDFGATFEEIADFVEANPGAVFEEPR